MEFTLFRNCIALSSVLFSLGAAAHEGHDLPVVHPRETASKVSGRDQRVQKTIVAAKEFSQDAAGDLNTEANTGSPENVSVAGSSFTGLLERFLGFVREKSDGKGLIVPRGIPLPRPPPANAGK